jgi:ABC-2 type transport system permease protein
MCAERSRSTSVWYGRDPVDAFLPSEREPSTLPAIEPPPAMTSSAVDHPVRVSTARVGVFQRMADVWRRRELLVVFVRTALKLKYKNSVLGFFWSLANPALYLVVFYVVFELVLETGIPDFSIFLLSGLLVWNLFSSSLASATSSVLVNGGLVKKVAFPREILPLASVGAALVHFFLQSIVLAGALIVFGYSVGAAYLPLVPLALVTLLLLCAALAVLFSALNVRLRDTGHFVELGLLAWFWMTPIIYPYMLVNEKLGSVKWVALLNPLTSIVLAFQRALYNRTSGTEDGVVTKILPDGADFGWYARNLAIVAIVSIVALLGALTYFGRVEADFAEEL